MLSLESLAKLIESDPAAIQAKVESFEIGGLSFDGNSRSSIMGVINLSPDSWYRESVSLSTEAAIQRGRVLSAQGAAMIDVGAESSLAQAARVDESSQQSRLIPVIRGLRSEQILVSVETYHPSVTRACLEAGANVLNLTGNDGTDEIYRMVADYDAGVIICFVQGRNVREVGDFNLQADATSMLRDYFAREIDRATRAGVRRIFVDPGLGFYYRNLQDSSIRVRHQMQVFLNTFRLRTLGWPTCHALPHAFEFFRDEVRSAEPFFAVLAALGRTDLFRTHEVPRVKAVLDTMQIL